MPTSKIVVVDTDRELAKQVTGLIGRLGFDGIDGVGFGMEAVTTVNALSPDAVLVRVDEPFEPAIRTIERLTDFAPDRPIVAYSAQANTVALRQSMQGGASDYLETPLSVEDLRVAITRALARKEREGKRRRGELPPSVCLGTIITVFGAKGGIGKTTIATNLAISLAQWADQTVALVDLDTRFGDVAIALDLKVERSMSDLVHNMSNLSRESLGGYLTRHSSGVCVLPAPSRPSDWRELRAEDLKSVLDVLAQTHDFVVVDTPGTFNAFVGTALEVATVILAVTTPEVPSIKDTVISLDLLAEHFDDGHQNVRVLVNQEGMPAGIRTSEIESTIGQPIWWSIPHDPEVLRSTQLGLPVVLGCPGGKTAREFRSMARALSGSPCSVRRKAPGTRRLAGKVGRLLRAAA